MPYLEKVKHATQSQQPRQLKHLENVASDRGAILRRQQLGQKQIKREACQKIHEKATLYVVDGNELPVADDHISPWISVASLKHDKDVQSKYDIYDYVGHLNQLKVLVYSLEGELLGCHDRVVNRKYNNHDVPLELKPRVWIECVIEYLLRHGLLFFNLYLKTLVSRVRTHPEQLPQVIDDPVLPGLPVQVNKVVLNYVQLETLVPRYLLMLRHVHRAIPKAHRHLIQQINLVLCINGLNTVARILL